MAECFHAIIHDFYHMLLSFDNLNYVNLFVFSITFSRQTSVRFVIKPDFFIILTWSGLSPTWTSHGYTTPDKDLYYSTQPGQFLQAVLDGDPNPDFVWILIKYCSRLNVQTLHKLYIRSLLFSAEKDILYLSFILSIASKQF